MSGILDLFTEVLAFHMAGVAAGTGILTYYFVPGMGTMAAALQVAIIAAISYIGVTVLAALFGQM